MLHGHARVVKAVKGHVKFPEGYNPQVTIWHTQVIPYLKAIYPVDTRRRFNVYVYWVEMIAMVAQACDVMWDFEHITSSNGCPL